MSLSSRRSDARANRERILAVAREALAADPEASIHSIAKAAGVGQGTLYRHFPTREALVLGVYREGIDDLVVLASSLLDEHRPMRAFRLWCRRFGEYAREKHGIAALIRSAMSERHFAETYSMMVDAVRRMMQACSDEGELSDPADPEDFLQALALFMQLATTADGLARSERLLDLAFRGLGARDGPEQTTAYGSKAGAPE